MQGSSFTGNLHIHILEGALKRILENDPFAVTIANDSTTWVVGWAINPTTDLHDPLVLQGTSGAFSLVSVPNPSNGGDSGFAAVTTVPGGGMWAVGVTSTSKSNYSTLIEFHP